LVVEVVEHMVTEEIDEDFEKIVNDDSVYMTKQELRMRRLIEERLAAANFINSLEVCELGGDQTLPINLTTLEAQVRQMSDRLEELQTQLKSLEQQFAHIEVESLPENVQSEFKRIKNQIRELRDSGITASYHAQHIRGYNYDSTEPFDPMKQSNALCNFMYGDEHGNLLDEIKQKQIEMGIRDAPTVVDVDAEFDKFQFDNSKCAEAIMKNGQVQQCPHFKMDGSKYCIEHKKKYEEKTR